jgi:hypothetical protein
LATWSRRFGFVELNLGRRRRSTEPKVRRSNPLGRAPEDPAHGGVFLFSGSYSPRFPPRSCPLRAHGRSRRCPSARLRPAGVKHQLRLTAQRHPTKDKVPRSVREDLVYDFKGGSLRWPPAPAAGGRKRPSSPGACHHPACRAARRRHTACAWRHTASARRRPVRARCLE